MNQNASVLLSAAVLALGMVWPQSVGVASDALALIPAGSNWGYWDRTNYPGDAWRGLAFDDRGWSNGPAMLGFGEADGVFPTTFIASNRQWTAYFRHHFILANAAAYTNFVLSLQRDDGAVVWLNGNEIWRHGLPDTGPILPDTPATRDVGGPNEARFWSTNLVTIPLESGTNVLAVEVHQAYSGSSDLTFDFELTADEIGRPVITVPANQMLNQSPAALQLTATVQDDGTPLPADPASPDPNDPHKLRWAWSVVSIPAASEGVVWSGNPTNGEAFAYAGSPNSPGTLFTCDPTATLDVPGLYIFEFGAADGEKTASRRVTVSVMPSGEYRQLGYSYLSPVPGAECCPTQTRHILVRFKDVAPTAITNLSTFITVAGTSSGDHAGRTRIATDGRTVIFTLTTGLASNELVTATLVPILAAGAGGSVEPYQFQFMISRLMPGSEPLPRVGSLSPPWDKSFSAGPADRAEDSAAPVPRALTAKAMITARGVSVPSDFPQPVITVSERPAPGYLFLENAGQGGFRYAMILDNDGSPLWYRRGGGWGLKVQQNGLITWDAFAGADKNFNFVRNYSAANGHATDDHELEVLADGGYLLLGFHDQPGVDMTRSTCPAPGPMPPSAARSSRNSRQPAN